MQLTTLILILTALSFAAWYSGRSRAVAAAAPGASGQVRLSGEVGEIDRNRRSFEVRAESGIFTVILPPNPTAEMVRRFEGLQTGQTISVEGTRVGADGVQLSRIL